MRRRSEDRWLDGDSDGEDEVRQRLLAWEISQMQGFGTTDAEWDGLLLVLFLATGIRSPM